MVYFLYELSFKIRLGVFTSPMLSRRIHKLFQKSWSC